MIAAISNSIAFSHKRQINDECTLCLATSAGCFVVAGCGLLLNLSPEHTHFQGLLMVAAFYLWLGIVSVFQPQCAERKVAARNHHRHHRDLAPRVRSQTYAPRRIPCVEYRTDLFYDEESARGRGTRLPVRSRRW